MVLMDPGVPELARRLREEIDSLGFEVVNVREDDARQPLELRARALGAVAAIRITLFGPGTVDMSIVDRATGKTVSRKLAIATSSDPAATELIATRTVELLRASFMELSATHPARGDVPVPAEARALSVVDEASRGSGSVSVTAGPALTFDGGGFGPSFGVWSALTVFVRSELADMALTSIALRVLRAAKLASTTVLLLACSTQYADPIRREAGEASDPCSERLTEAECQGDTAHGCSFQPNDPGCRPQDLGCAPGICRGGDPFVRRSGETLWLHGDPYRFSGAVSLGLAWAEDGCRTDSQPDFETNLTRTFQDLVPMRASVLKVWAFQSFAGPTGTDYTAFERIATAARRAGVRLIFVLETHWAECSRGGERDDAWYATGHAAPYGGYALSFPDYTRRLVTHFRDEPTILGWEIMHEARGESFERAEQHRLRTVPKRVAGYLARPVL